MDYFFQFIVYSLKKFLRLGDHFCSAQFKNKALSLSGLSARRRQFRRSEGRLDIIVMNLRTSRGDHKSGKNTAVLFALVCFCVGGKRCRHLKIILLG